MSAYDEMYLQDAMMTLGQMTDYGVNDCGFSVNTLFGMFEITGTAQQFAAGNPRFVAGMSGEELARYVFEAAGLRRSFPVAAVFLDRSREYWCGWVLAYCQWAMGRPFARLRQIITPEELLSLYPALHEAPEEKTLEVFRNREKQRLEQSQLARYRKYAGLTQAALSRKADVSLRSVQMYEQRRKDINKAQSDALFRLAGALGCAPEELLET